MIDLAAKFLKKLSVTRSQLFRGKNFRLRLVCAKATKFKPKMTANNSLTKFFFIKSATVLFYCFFFLIEVVFSEKMPLKYLTTADGLPQNSINCIYQDKKGFFWIGTNGGLARYDGYEFVSFTKNQGLPRNEILDFLETGDGEFWLATKGGLVKFTPDGKIFDRTITEPEAASMTETPTFITFPPDDAKNLIVTKLWQDSRGVIWVGTGHGLFKLEKNNNKKYEFFPVNIDFPASDSKYIYEIYEDQSGAVWIGTDNALTRILPDNQILVYRVEGKPSGFSTIVEDRSGRIWVGTSQKGLFQFAVDKTGMPQMIKWFSGGVHSEIEGVDKIVEASDGKLWIGSGSGLDEFDPNTGKLLLYTRSSGIGFYRFKTIFEDRQGNLWLGTQTNGIYRLSPNGLVSFELEDRISFVRGIGLDNANNLLLTTFVTNTELDERGARVARNFTNKQISPYHWRLGELTENGFDWLIPAFSKKVSYFSYGENQVSLQARNGEWWIVTGKGLFRFPKVAFEQLKMTSPMEVFDEKHGLRSEDVFHIYEDSQSDIWIATSSVGENSGGIYKWKRAAGTLEEMTAKAEFAAVKNNLVTSFAEDRAGNIWFGFYNSGFARYRGGEIDFFDNRRNIPPGGIGNLFVDRENRLWLATRQGGILRIDEPTAENPAIRTYTEADGLSSNRTLSVTEDLQGFIYIGTDRDISRLNPRTDEFRHLNLAKTQLQREYRSAICDKQGVLWFGTTEGLVKYAPIADTPEKPPEILLTGVNVEGVPQRVSASGADEVNLLPLAPSENQVRIDYVSLSNFENADIRYQYKLNEDEWSPPSFERFVNFANLSSGDYQILIRAVAGNAVSEKSVIVSFKILAPVYLRPWFMTLVVLTIMATIYAFYRSRLGKLLEIERTRTLIATDLHDDIGSNLSKISILSEVVRLHLDDENTEQNRLLNSIAETSRKSVASMSDIVWAINPKRDSVLEMTRKMREHAEEIFVPKNIKVEFFEPKKGANKRICFVVG